MLLSIMSLKAIGGSLAFSSKKISLLMKMCKGGTKGMVRRRVFEMI